MSDMASRGSLIGCGGFVLLLLIGLVAVPFTRFLAVGLIGGEPIGEDLRPLSSQIRRLSDPDPAVVDRAIDEIQKMGERGTPAIPALLDLARDPERGSRPKGKFGVSTVRESALSTIGRMGSAGATAVPDLLSFLTHPHVRTRVAALVALREIGPASVAEPRPIIAALDDRDLEYGTPELLRQHAPEVLKREIHRRLAPELTVTERLKACRWASNYGPESRDLVLPLRSAMSDPDPAVREAARNALRSLWWDLDAADPFQPLNIADQP